MRHTAQPRTAVAIIAVAVAALLLSAASAPAAVITDRPLLFSFDGSGSSIGPFSALSAIAVDEGSGFVYALNQAGTGQGPGPYDGERVACKFSAEGEAQNFTAGEAAGKSCLDGKEAPDGLEPHDGAFGIEGFFGDGSYYADLAIDNSTVNPGRIYVSEDGGPIHAFASSGAHLWTLTGTESCGIGVDKEGHLWVGNGSSEQNEANFKALEFANTGSPPVQIGSVTMTNANKRPCRLAFDESGEDLYVGLRGAIPSSLDKYIDLGVETAPGQFGRYDSTLVADGPFEVTADQSSPSGHVFAAKIDGTGANFVEFDSADSAIPGSPFGRDLIGNAKGIAYNPYDPDEVGPEPPLDRVYVSDRATNTVKVFGPVTSGTAPDVSCGPTDGITRTEATANCTINPLGLANSYHFEYKRCASTGCAGQVDANWGRATSSASQSIEPPDSASHPVSLELQNLSQNSWYEVRLVGTNAEPGMNSLSAYSTPVVFQTLPPPPPTIECEVPEGEITSSSAEVTCEVDGMEDATNWKIMKRALSGASQAECEAAPTSSFSTVAEGEIPASASGPQPIAADLEDLDPAQSYCVRATATNSGGADQDNAPFKTLAVPPSEASAAFAAPRTDTTARINARVNPGGEADFEYQLEWSEDGSTWTELPIHESSVHAREPVVVADELNGLQPATTYHYRLKLARNEAGSAPSLGEEKTFTTRTTAEMEAASPPSCPNADVRAAQHTTYLGSCRGVELVNSPDKGNQNALAYGPGVTFFTSPVSATGDALLWKVEGGAPGGPNGAENSFLARRTALGWSSTSAAPPAEEQAGGGELTYSLITASSDFDSLLVAAALSTGAQSPEPTTFVRVRKGVQDILMANSVGLITGYESDVDMSEDGEHVFALNPDNAQLEDIGAARVGPPEIPGEVISIMPNGEPSKCGLDVSEGESFRGAAGSLIGQPGDHWVATDDGSRAYFRARPDGNCGSAYGLYVRNRETGETTLIDSGDPEFLRTTPDGHQGYFATHSSLDPVDTDANTPDLYEWDEDTGATGEARCLTCQVRGPDFEDVPAHLAVDAGTSGTLNSVLISPDFSRIYFYSKQKLFADRGRQGALNLYVLEGDEVHFVAVTQSDALRGETQDISANGQVLLFRAQATPGLSADQMASQCIQPGGGLGGCTQLYLYDDRDQSIECLSCRHGALTTHSYGAPAVQNAPRSGELSDDGATVAFATAETLLGLDVNDDIDIYEWKSGTLHLVTDGVSEAQKGLAAPRVWGLDADGSDLYFGVVPPAGSLTGFERDGLLNVYDARIDGGFMPPSPPEPCEGDSCQGPLAAPPPLEQPVTTGTSRGNVVEPRPGCRKGKVRRRGRCVPRRALNRRACARRHGAAKRRCIAKQHRRAARANRRADR